MDTRVVPKYSTAMISIHLARLRHHYDFTAWIMLHRLGRTNAHQIQSARQSEPRRIDQLESRAG
jgi:hypothetical protein